jgi:DNA (cytosine-5)-methyltransferase 1
MTFLDVISEIKPKNFVMEEVTGLLNMGGGLVLEQILEKASKIGYTCTRFTLHAEDYGVPQKRRRLFIFGSRTDEKIDKPKPIFGNNTELKKLVAVKDAIGDLSSIQPKKEIMPLKYSNKKTLTPYQKWARGIISFDQFVEQQDAN